MHEITLWWHGKTALWYGWQCSCGRKSKDTRYGTPGGAERAGLQHAKVKTAAEQLAASLAAQVAAAPRWVSARR